MPQNDILPHLQNHWAALPEMKKIIRLLLVFALMPLVSIAQEVPSLHELRAKAEAGDVDAQWDFAAVMPIDSPEANHWHRKAFNSYLQSAKQGDVKAQLRVGQIFHLGLGVEQNYEEALKWLKAAAEKNDIQATDLISSMYSTGTGVPKDAAESEKWRKRAFDLCVKAGEDGDAYSLYRLACAYRSGDGVAKDKKEALKWLRMAGNRGSLLAQKELGKIFYWGDGVPTDQPQSALWYKKAADQYKVEAEYGIAEAQYQYGKMLKHAADATYRYPNSRVFSSEYREAALWFLKAARQRNSAAPSFLAYAYYLGQGVPKDEVEGMAWAILGVAGATDQATKKILNDLLMREELNLGPDKMRLAKARSKEIAAEIDSENIKNNSQLSTKENTECSDIPKFSGSGAIVTAQGHVLTAAHVVADATRITVVTAKGTMAAKVLRKDESNDIAILKIEGGSFVPLPIAQSRRIRLGQTVATIGFPNVKIQGFSPKVTRGEISSQNGAGDDPRSWQISVPVQTGNSGGPLLDENGNLIGIVVSKLGIKAAMATGDLPQNVNYAVKSAYALALLEPYLDNNSPEPNQPNQKRTFEDMVSSVQQSVVLVLIY